MSYFMNNIYWETDIFENSVKKLSKYIFFKFSQANFKLVSNTHFCLTFIIRIDLKSTSITNNYKTPIFCHPKKGKR